MEPTPVPMPLIKPSILTYFDGSLLVSTSTGIQLTLFFFALYIYEHNEDNPSPNTRTMYISYLASVYFMKPKKLRTFVYHEILIAYLDFATAYIWACLPLKGDNYMFYAKNEG